MEQGAKTAHLLDELRREMSILSDEKVDIVIRNDIDENHNGDPAATVIITIDGDAEYAMYSSSSVMALQTYLRGFTHAVRAASGTYAFKPLTEAAKRRRMITMLPVVYEGRKARFDRAMSTLTKPCDVGEPVTMTLDRLRRGLGAVTRTAAYSPRFALWRCKYKPE